jgi:C-terminal processing protease CtpA/Prc
MTVTAWDRLPNKIHIDQVLVDLKNHANLFTRVRKQAWNQAWQQAWKQAWNQARDQARDQVYDQARDQAHIQAWEQVYDQLYVHARDQTYYVATNALLALIAYDDASKYLTIPIDQAMVYGELVDDNQYILLKPYLLVQHEIALLATA